MSELLAIDRRLRVSGYWFAMVIVVLSAPVRAVAQERTIATSPWSTAVLPENKSEARGPRRGEKKSRPLAAVVPVLPNVPPVTAAFPAPAPSAVEPSLPAAAVEQQSSRVPVARPADRLEHETVALEYCRNAVPATGEARAAFLHQAIASLERDLARKTQELEERIAEHKDWMARRQQLMDQAGTALVQMFARMRPDAAAQQVSLMNEPVAAALLMKLEPRVSSALLSEMPPARAARLAAIIAAAAELSPRQTTAKSEPKQ